MISRIMASLATALLLVCVVASPGHADTKKSHAKARPAEASQPVDDPTALKIGVDGAYPPFSMKDKKGKLTGFDIEIAQAICEQIKAKCRLMPMENWAEVIPGIEARKYDAVVASMSITDERLKRIDFSNKYYSVPARFVAKKGTKLVDLQSELKTKRVGVQGGTTHSDFLLGRFGGSIKAREFLTLPEALEALARGELDLVLADSLTVQSSFLTSKEGKDFEMVGPVFDDRRWFGDGNGVALPKGSDELKTRINQAIAELRANGRYQQIATRYFGLDIYGN